MKITDRLFCGSV